MAWMSNQIPLRDINVIAYFEAGLALSITDVWNML